VDTAKARNVKAGVLFALVGASFLPWSYDPLFIKNIMLALAALYFSILLFRLPAIRIKKDVFLAASLPAWWLISAVFSKFPHASVMPLALLGAAFVIFLYLSTQEGFEPEEGSAILVYSALLAASVAVAGVFLSGAGMSGAGEREYLYALLPVAIWLFWQKKGAARILPVLYTAVVIFIIFWNSDKSSAAGLLLAASYYFLIYLNDRFKDRKKWIFAALFAVVAAASAAAYHYALFTKEPAPVRAQVLKGAASAAGANLFTGSGPGTFSIIFPKFRPAEMMAEKDKRGTEVLYPGNFLLQAAAETGVPGALLVCWLLAVLFSRVNAATRHYGAGVVFLLAVNLTGSGFNHPLQVLLLAVFCAGIIKNYAGEEREVKPPAVKIGAIVVSVTAFLIFSFAQASHHYLWKGRPDIAVKWNPYSAPALYAAACGLYDLAPEKNGPEALEYFYALEKVSPDYSLSHYKKARVLMMGHDFERAAAEYEKMLAVDPYYTPAIKELAFIYFSNKQNFGKAEGYIIRVLENNSSDPELYNMLGNIYFADKRAAEAIIAYKKAIDLTPRKDYYYNLGCVYFTLGKIKEARACLEKSGELSDGGDPKTMQIMRVITQYEKLNELDTGSGE
jgi:tetratricopeptide (TPR) repeat protein